MYKVTQDPSYRIEGIPVSIRGKITEVINSAIEFAFKGTAHPADAANMEVHLDTSRMYLEQTIKNEIVSGNLHLDKVVEYMFRDEFKHFCECHDLDLYRDDLPKHKFTKDQKTHIFYHVFELSKL